MAYLQFEAIGLPRVRTELSVAYIDHNTLQTGFENADDHRYIQTVRLKNTDLVSKRGEGGLPSGVHIERFGVPERPCSAPTAIHRLAAASACWPLVPADSMWRSQWAADLIILTMPQVVKTGLTGKL